MSEPSVTIEDVRAAAARIAPHIHRTPVATSATLDRELGAEVFFKCENLQKVGAFKARGALNKVLSLPAEEAANGVVTHSSGNHGAAVAYAAAIRRIPATVVVPADATPPKVEAIRGYGATVVLCDQFGRESMAAEVQAETGAVLVHPFDDIEVIAGQGTAALELFEEVADLDVIATPIGGGGLLSGTAVVTRALSPEVRIIGAEPQTMDDSYRSFLTGVRQPRVTDKQSIADGTLTGIGEITFELLRLLGVEVVLVPEDGIVEAALFHLHRMKLVAEPSGSLGLGALRIMGPEIEGRRVGVIISGGNTDFSWMDS